MNTSHSPFPNCKRTVFIIIHLDFAGGRCKMYSNILQVTWWSWCNFFDVTCESTWKLSASCFTASRLHREVGSSASLWLVPQEAKRAELGPKKHATLRRARRASWEQHERFCEYQRMRLTIRLTGTRFLRFQDFKEATIGYKSGSLTNQVPSEASQLLLSGHPRWPKAPSRFANRGDWQDMT